MSDHPSKNFDKNKPVAWAFYNNDGSLRFVIDSERKMISHKSSHNGSIVPLIHMRDNANPELGREYLYE